MPDVSGWWLLVAFWIGGCLSILLVALLHMVRNGDDAEEHAVFDVRRSPLGGEQVTAES